MAATFDRPIDWMEHATVGPPFAEPGLTTLDVSATRGLIGAGRPGNSPRGKSRRSALQFEAPSARDVPSLEEGVFGPVVSPSHVDHHHGRMAQAFVQPFGADERRPRGVRRSRCFRAAHVE